MTNSTQYQQYFEFVRYAMNPLQQSCPDFNRIDWYDFYKFACEQAIVGVIFEGIKRLNNHNVKPSFDVLMKWVATAEEIEGQNRKLNQECQRLTQLFESEGHKTAILKGQANATLYPNPLSRQSGDVDFYMDGGEKKF